MAGHNIVFYPSCFPVPTISQTKGSAKNPPFNNKMFPEREQKFTEVKRGCHNNSVAYISDKKESLVTDTLTGF